MTAKPFSLSFWPIMAMSSARSTPVPDATFVPAAVAPARMSLPHVDGLSTPKMPAWSIFLPMASAMSGLTVSHRLIFASSTTESGIGTITASSSAVICTSSHPVFDVCLSPPSDTQYASGSEASTGCVFFLLLIGTRRARVSSTLDCGSVWMISWLISSGMSAPPKSPRRICKLKLSAISCLL